jgi:uncharacterized protein YggE
MQDGPMKPLPTHQQSHWRRALTAAALAVAAAQAPLAAAADSDAPARRAVTVSGHGEVTAAPDRARLSMQVELTRPGLQAAQAEAGRIVREFLAQARALGAAEQDISTAGFSIRAEYSYSDKFPDGRKFVGYHVERGIEVVVRDLDHIGDFLARATAAGFNAVGDPQLESSRADELKRQALALAAADAKAKATVLAEALGVRLGTVHTINAALEMPPAQPRVLRMAKAMAPGASENEQMGFAAGAIVFDANVTVEFELAPP